MKSFSVKLLFVVGCLLSSGFSILDDEAEFVCLRTHKSTNTCYYNFKIGGMPHHFKDVGCKRKKDKVIEDVNAGELALSKEWKIPCPEEKKPDSPSGL
jgi:hypothetical protein